MEVKDILKARRQELGLTMKEVARLVGVNEGTISRWESGDIANMRRDKIMALSKALQISPAVIMEWDVKIPNEEGGVENISNLRDDEHRLLGYYNQLNDAGKAKAMSDISDMTELSKYRKDTVLKNA